MINAILNKLKKNFTEISIFLCFTLPPVGIALFVFSGWLYLHQIFKQRKPIILSPGVFLISSLFVSSFGAAIAMGDYSYFLVSALLLAYLGLYVKIKNNSVKKTIYAFKWINILGGIYFYSLYPIQQVLMNQKVISYFMGTVLIGHSNVQHYERLMGAAYNPNFSVALLLFGLSFLLAEFHKNIRRTLYRKSALQAVIIGMFIHAIYLTESRAGFSIMLIIFVLLSFRWNKLWASLFVLLLGMSNHIIVNWMPRSEQLVESTGIRKEIWRNSYELWQDHSLFGVTALGFYKEYFYHFNERIPHAHNLIIGIFTEYGALGGVAFVIVVIINIYKVASFYLAKTGNKEHLDVFLLSLPVILLTGVFDYVLYSPQVAVLAIILMACWDRYTEQLHLSPRVMYYVKKWVSSIPFKSWKNKKQSTRM
ncbi:O-antigen ligase family protein [Fictibacillus sp. 26RED30]|uniref:O-antigen ligase family protein n=1 Tax=Fictibacillus sp. 26RED30 TaxID=2745877 RepID=UPI0018CCC400|nr:O-antigen ligase family protein [Fictibacillus sp. 26RED30]MBH0161841.1 O-antigen ligase family protein [Fictibacillus sp. 26RED30]